MAETTDKTETKTDNQTDNKTTGKTESKIENKTEDNTENKTEEKLKSSTFIIDQLLGGYEKDIITTIYGPAGSGKTTLCLLCAMNTAREGKKVIYIDTENNFSVERL